MGGKRKKLAGTGRGAVGKSVVIGLKDRKKNKVRATIARCADLPILQSFVRKNTETGVMIYTDEAAAYCGLAQDYGHEVVSHGTKEFVCDMAYACGMAWFWSMFKRMHAVIFRTVSAKHLDLYVTEFADKHNIRNDDMLDQMAGVVAGMPGRRLRYSDLIVENELDSEARS